MYAVKSSRWCHQGVLAMAVVLGILAGPGDCAAQQPGAVATPIEGDGDIWPPVPNFARHYRYPVVQVLRGDLLRIRYQKGYVTLRLAGVDATNAPARTLLRELVEGREIFIVYPRGRTEDDEGRPMPYVYRCEDNLLVNLELISTGHGLMAPTPGHLRSFLEAHERIAEREQRGLWAQGSLRTYKDPVSDEYRNGIKRIVELQKQQQEDARARRDLVNGLVAPSNSKAYNNEVRIANRLTHDTKVELVRPGQLPKFRRTFSVPAGTTRSVRVPDGDFKIFFEMSDEPGVRYEGDPFTLSENGVEIKLEVKAGGNYGLRKAD